MFHNTHPDTYSTTEQSLSIPYLVVVSTLFLNVQPSLSKLFPFPAEDVLGDLGVRQALRKMPKGVRL